MFVVFNRVLVNYSIRTIAQGVRLVLKAKLIEYFKNLFHFVALVLVSIKIFCVYKKVSLAIKHRQYLDLQG